MMINTANKTYITPINTLKKFNSDFFMTLLFFQ